MRRYTKVVILLATYNGEQYLEEQINSILSQTYRNILIIVRDDCSSDLTSKIILNYKLRNPELFHIVENNGKRLGPSKNFSFLIQYTLNQKESLGLFQYYIMFCDQDDIWSKVKIEKQVEKMIAVETEFPQAPILIHSDLHVVDENGALIFHSFMQYQSLKPERKALRHQLNTNVVTGCTSMINVNLATLVSPIPNNVIMHDWWISICASAFGKLECLPSPLVSYRQHKNNTIGAKKYNSHKIYQSINLENLLDNNSLILYPEILNQVKLFESYFKSSLTINQKIEIMVIKKTIFIKYAVRFAMIHIFSRKK